MKLNGAEAMVRMLELYGVKHIFGLCGDTSLPFYDALYRLDHGIDHVLTRDERSAGYMAVVLLIYYLHSSKLMSPLFRF
jgi:acetolactate synthase-1/2/3 large subunit